MTPEGMKTLWASHCRYEFELRDADTSTRLRDLPLS
jgi:hypothetical protein